MRLRATREKLVMKRAPVRYWQNFSAIFLFYLLLFSYPLLTLLWRRNYSIFSAEVGILFLLIIASAILLAFILSKVRTIIGVILTSLLITITFLVQFNLLLEGMLISVVASLVIAWRIKAKIYLYSLPVLVALLLGAWFDSVEDARKALSVEVTDNVNPELPPIVHILLDGFVGPEGLPSNANAAIFKEEFYRLFYDFGFQVFPRAYSRYSATVDSLYSAFNFKSDAENNYSLEVLERREHILKSNIQFDLLESLGYRFNIYQTGHLDFCKSNPNSLDRCWEYAQPNIDSLQYIKSIQMRTRMLARVLLTQSAMLSEILSARGWLNSSSLAVHDPRVFSRLKNDVLSEPDGKFFFAHVLLPHAPYVFMHDCSINYNTAWRGRYPMIKDEPVQIESVYKLRANLYFEQMECALFSLRQVFDDMKRAGIYEQSIIVLHGDHGSMLAKYIPRYWNINNLTSSDYRAHFSTLFAVRFPNAEFQIDDRILPLSVLLEGFSKTVHEYITGNRSDKVFSEAVSNDPEKVAKYIYLLGSAHMQKVEVNIFED